MKFPARLILSAALVPAAYSQSVLFTFDGGPKYDHFGYSVSGAGDVDGDGYADVIVGAYRSSPNGSYSGGAIVFSRMAGGRLHAFDGASAGDHFGTSVSGAGDVNGDGYADLIVGAHLETTPKGQSGTARVFSGLDGSVLYLFNGDSEHDLFGNSVSGAGDVNGDGIADLIVGAKRDDNNGTNSGSARVFSGADGSPLYTFDGDSAYDEFGLEVSGAGDVNGDGYADLIVGAPSDDNNGTDSGSASVFSGVDGSLLHAFNGSLPLDFFGSSVAGAGDVNGDGYHDLIVGARGANKSLSFSGSATVFSGADGSVLYTFLGVENDDWFGRTVSGAGDVNGDGHDDLIVGAQGDPNIAKVIGRASVFSGADGRVFYTAYGDSVLDRFGFSVSGAGDVNGDGFADVIVGASYSFDGYARVFSGCDALGISYCSPAAPNSLGKSAVISACGSGWADADYLMLHATELPPGRFGYFLASETQGFIPNPGGSQGNLCLGGQLARFNKQIQKSGPDGKFSIRVGLTNIPTTPPHFVLWGETWNFQAWYRDTGVGSPSNFTDGVAVTFN